MPVDPHQFFEERILGAKPSPDDHRKLVELLWEAYGESVFLYCYVKLENIEDARDVCQDAFVQAMQWLQANPGRMPPKINFPAWLRRIARNLVIDRFRRPALKRDWPRERAASGDDEAQYADWPDMRICDPVEHITREEQLDALRKCIDILPEVRRRIVILRDIEGRSYDEIAREAGMPKSTVGVTLHRARKELRECVELRLAS